MPFRKPTLVVNNLQINDLMQRFYAHDRYALHCVIIRN